MLFVCHSKILHKHCLQCLLRVKMAPEKLKKMLMQNVGWQTRALWYVMEFSRVVSWDWVKQFRNGDCWAVFSKTRKSQQTKRHYGNQTQKQGRKSKISLFCYYYNYFSFWANSPCCLLEKRRPWSCVNNPILDCVKTSFRFGSTFEVMRTGKCLNSIIRTRTSL